MINEIEEANSYLNGVNVNKNNNYRAVYMLSRYYHGIGNNEQETREILNEWKNKYNIEYYDINNAITEGFKNNRPLREKVNIDISKYDVEKIVSLFDNRSCRLLAFALLCYSVCEESINQYFSVYPTVFSIWLGISRQTFYNSLNKLEKFGYISVKQKSSWYKTRTKGMVSKQDKLVMVKVYKYPEKDYMITGTNFVNEFNNIFNRFPITKKQQPEIEADIDINSQFAVLGYNVISSHKSNKYTVEDKEGYKYLLNMSDIKRRTGILKFSRANPYTIDNLNLYADKKCLGIQLVSTCYIDSATQMIWVCNRCGKLLNYSLDFVLSKFRKCPSCYKDNSNIEERIEETLVENEIEYIRDYSFPDLYGSSGNRLRYQFAIMENNKLLFLLEYLNNKGKKKKWHEEAKEHYCSINNINLQHIQVDDIPELSDMLKTLISDFKKKT